MQASVYAYVSEFHSAEKKSTSTAFVSTFMAFTSIYLPFLAWLIVPIQPWWLWGMKFSSWRMFLIVASSLNVISVIGISILPESPKFLLSMEREDAAMSVLHRIYRMNADASHVVSLNLFDYMAHGWSLIIPMYS